jgi:hypothetical protein
LTEDDLPGAWDADLRQDEKHARTLSKHSPLSSPSSPTRLGTSCRLHELELLMDTELSTLKCSIHIVQPSKTVASAHVYHRLDKAISKPRSCVGGWRRGGRRSSGPSSSSSGRQKYLLYMALCHTR